MKNIRWLSVLAALMLPISALASSATLPPTLTPTPRPAVQSTPTPTQNVTVPDLPAVSTNNTLEENIAVLLPTLAPAVSLQIIETENEYAIDLEAYYAGDYNLSVTSYQMPAMIPDEIQRTSEAKARYAAGERPEKQILNLTENVSIGVYELPADQYQGESTFVILPNRELTDDELLQLVDAFAVLQLDFNPSNLSWRNCMRGGSIECTRGFTQDEMERSSSLRNLYQRGMIAPEGTMTPLPAHDGFGSIELNPDEFCGMSHFRFFPARRLTDEELLQYVAPMLDNQLATAGEYAAWEIQLRQQLYLIMGTPLSSERTSESLYVESDSSIWGVERKLYRAQFALIGENGIGNHEGSILTESGELASATIFSRDLIYSDVRSNPFDVKWQDIAVNWVNTHRKDGISVVRADCYGEEWQSCGYGSIIKVTMEDGGVYTIRVHFGTEQVYDVEYCDAVRAASEDAFWMNYISDRMQDTEGGR